MCFSAEASFAAGAVLVPAGIYCVHRAIQEDRSYLAFAATPLLFAIQQTCEGLVWIGLESGNENLVQYSAIAFLFFAITFWPFWVPWSGRCIEKRRMMRAFFSFAAGIGLIAGIGFLGAIVLAPDVLSIEVVGHSIRYVFSGSPAYLLFPGLVWQILYVILISSPLMLASGKMVKSYVITVIIAAVICHVFYWYVYISVWCYFAAVLSLHLCIMFYSFPMNQQTRSSRGLD